MKINGTDECIFLPIVNSVFDKLDCALSETRYVRIPDIITNLSSMLEKSFHSFSILELCKQSFMNKLLPKKNYQDFCLELKLRLFDGWCFLQLSLLRAVGMW